MASLKNIINSDDEHDPSPETSMQHLPSDSSAADTYPTTRPDQPAALHNDLINPARHSSRFFASEPPSLSSSGIVPGRRPSNTSVDSMDGPYDANYVMPSGSNFMRPIQRNPATEHPIKLTPITGKISKAKKGVPVHNCDKCPKTFTRAEHLRRHQLTHGAPELCCHKPNCGKTFYRKDLFERHLQRHEIDDPIKNDPNRWSRYRPKTPPSQSYGNTNQDSGLRMPQGLAGTQPDGSDVSRTTPMTTSPWPPSTTAPSASPDHTSQRGQPTEGYSLVPNEFVFDQTTMPGLQPTTGSYVQPFTTPRTMPGLGLYIPETQTTTAWDPTIPSSASASESTYSTPSDNTHPHRFPVRTSSGDWNTQVPAFNSHNGTQSHSPILDNGAYIPFLYSSPQPQQLAFGNSLELPLPGYLGEDFFNLEQMPANNTVRSLPPQMGQSSETLVTVPAVPPNDFLNGAGCGRPEGLGLLASRSVAPDRLDTATREAIPEYLKVYWEKVYPLYPVIHRRMFDFVTEATKDYFDVLRCAMAAIATQYLTDKDDRVKGAQLYQYAWYKSKLANEWPQPVKQTLVLLEHYARFRGKKGGSHKPSQRFGTLYQRVYSTQNSFMPIPSEYDLVEQWMAWIDMETRRRLLAACFILDVHSAQYHERHNTPFINLGRDEPPIPLSGSTADLWEAPTPEDWSMLLEKSKPMTLEDINLETLTPSAIEEAPPFDGAIILAACAMHLPARQNPKELDLVRDASGVAVNDFCIARLFPASAVANTYLALHHTPLHILLSVSGDSWVFNEKISDPKLFVEHKAALRQWQKSGSAAVAATFAARALKAFLGLSDSSEGKDSETVPIQLRSSSSWKDISDYWGFYVCSLICWAFGYSGKRDSKTKAISQETTLRLLLTAANVEPGEVQRLSNRHEAHGVVRLAREELEAQCLMDRNFLLVDAVGALKALEQKHDCEWF
ncbi:hypothetical protein B0T10DRAFT_452303 [Thelonectria olida]|uniref:C2H2-type domain-containing protein n=1 Tax=Thelonectria olida TaxID=1576542 RepID=A0A9P9AX23_9HYPO|nr:hypothetical protein B0T10DRAFT_452303 [Thelonectria olida]